MTRLTLSSLLALLLAPTLASAITLTEVPTSILGRSGGDVEWGDFDNDGDLDLIVLGNLQFGGGAADIFRNDAGTFVNINAGLPPLESGSADWGDYDGDGDLDLAIMGVTDQDEIHTRLYRNDQGTFVQAAAFSPQYLGTIAFYDRDSDGDLDVGMVGTEYTATFLNQGNVFSGIEFDLEHGTFSASATFLDIDGDGHRDASYMGKISSPVPGGQVAIALVQYRSFGEPLGATVTLTGVNDGEMAWADYDEDGDLDVFVTGRTTDNSNLSILYTNDLTTFSPSLMSSVSRGGAEWGDADADGDLDLVYGGRDSLNNLKTILKRNDAGSLVTESPLEPMDDSRFAWGDYDGDGDQDLAAMGANGADRHFILYRNDAFLSNTPPTVPTNLAVLNNADLILLSWLPSTDFETAQNSLSYNVRVGSAPGANDIVPSHSLADGTRLKPGMGNTAQANTLILDSRALSNGRAYWSVQAVDASGGTSPFATEQELFLPMSRELSEDRLLGWLSGDAALADITNDGFPELVLSGAHENDEGTIFFDLHDPSGKSQRKNFVAEHGDMAWADLDRDGDVDLVLANDNACLSYLNQSGQMVLTDLGLPAAGGGTVEAGDYDNDGDLDLLFSALGLYRNDGNTFTADAAFTGCTFGGFATFGDYDRDGDLDVLQGGSFGMTLRNRIQRNEGGSWTEILLSPPGNLSAAGCFVDYDRDGDLDVILASRNLFPSEVLRNDSGVFVLDPIASAGVPELSTGTIRPADFDHDGDQDLLLAGLWEIQNETLILENIGGAFAAAGTKLPQMEGTAAWGDFDRDHDLDVLMLGHRSDASPGAGLYRNNTEVANQRPNAPTNLDESILGNTLFLFWTQGTDAETGTFELTHNVRVGTSPGAGDVVPPMTLTDGTRLVFAPGNVGASSFFKLDLTNIAASALYWTVQTIDGSYASSNFAPEQSVALVPTATNPAGTVVAELRGAAPNPAANRTVVALTMPRSGHAAINVYDLRGRIVQTLHDGPLTTGSHQMEWDTRDHQGQLVASGSYFLRMSTAYGTQSRKVAVAR